MKALLKECKWYPVRPMRTFYEDGQLDKGWVESFCLGDWESGMPQGGICGGICPGEFIVGLFLGVWVSAVRKNLLLPMGRRSANLVRGYSPGAGDNESD